MPVSHEAAPVLSGLSPIGGRTIEVRFHGGLLSSDDAMMVLRQIRQRLGNARRLAASKSDPLFKPAIARQHDHLDLCSQSTV